MVYTHPVFLNNHSTIQTLTNVSLNLSNIKEGGAYIDIVFGKLIDNGIDRLRVISKKEQIFVQSAERCVQRYSQQKRINSFFPKSNMCAERKDGQDINIVITFESNKSNLSLTFDYFFWKSLSGAPLVCSFKTVNGPRYIQYGMLSQAAAYNKSPHLFVNLHNFKNWIDKNLNILK